MSITSPTKRHLSSRIVEGGGNIHHVEFNPSEVGSYVVEISINGDKLQGSPFIAKAYDSSQIRVSDVTNGAVGQPCQFRGRFLICHCINTTLSIDKVPAAKIIIMIPKICKKNT